MISKLFLLISSLSLYLIAVACIPLYRNFAFSRGILDVAGHRSSHQGVTPRGGGIVFFILWLLSTLMGFWYGLYTSSLLLAFIPGTLLAAAVGYWDDYHSLSPKLRLVGQLMAALLFLMALGKMGVLQCFIGTTLNSAWIIGPLVVLAVVWSINLFNFMDGIDGLASLEALFVLGIGGFIFWQSGVPMLALLAWSMVVLVAGFLVWNWPKATVFMGDVGSYCLGFLIAAFAIVGAVWYQIPIVLWIILYALFWFDATLTLLRRLYFNKKNWATPHRDHAYQRLHQSGFSHTKVLGITAMVNAILGMFALWGYYYPENVIYALCLSLLVVCLWYFWVERRYPQRRDS